ncbi:2-amino-4-hydroxy-6-hydroxymethyldihydropteridine diphosphokinase [Luteimonas pelagia]
MAPRDIPAPGVRAAIGLGANLGDAVATVRAAFDALDRLPGSRVVATSRLYRTPAWGLEAQPDFINAVAVLRTVLPPRDLLDGLLAIERAFGRDRATEAGRWGPRVLDLDLLLHGDSVVHAPGLDVPHPHLHARAFALVPLVEAWPDATIPGVGPAREALAGMARDGIEALS